MLYQVWLALTLQVSGLVVRPTTEQRMDKRPNIVFLMTDSMDGRLVDPDSAEFKAVDLPFLHGVLNKNGANFVHSYSNNPFCVPSRSSMVTGRNSDRIHVYANGEGLAGAPDGTLDDDCADGFFGKEWCKRTAKQQNIDKMHKLLPTALYELGYSVHMFGKWAAGAGVMNDVRKWSAESLLGNWTWFGTRGRGFHVDMQKNAFVGVPGGLMWNSIGDVSGTSGGELFQKYDEMGAQMSDPEDYIGDIAGVSDVELSRKYDMMGVDMNDPVSDSYNDLDIIHRCVDFINRREPYAEIDTAPFFLYCSINLPHYPFRTNSTWISRGVNSEQLRIPRWPQGGISQYHRFDQFMIKHKGDGKDPGQTAIADLRTTYYAMCVQADALLSLVWEALVAKGYDLTNTYVVYVSDHGELAYDHHQLHKGSLYEGSVRVPLQIAGPGISKQRITQVTSLLDVFPTLLDMAQETDWDKHSGLDGLSLLATAGATSKAPYRNQLAGRDYVISQYKAYFAMSGSYMIRSGVWKYITFGHTYYNSSELPPMLFNVEEDPEELKDVAKSNKDVASKLDKLLHEHVDVDAAELRCDMRFISYILRGRETDQYGMLVEKAREHFDAKDTAAFDAWFQKTWHLWRTHRSDYLLPGQ